MVEPGKTRPPPPKPPPMPKGPPPRTTTTTPKPSPARPASGPNDASEATVKRPRKRAGKLRWLLGWVIVPLVLLGALFLAGVHVGARHPQMWLSRATLWMFDREPQLGLTDEERQPLARTLRLLILPTKEHSSSKRSPRRPTSPPRRSIARPCAGRCGSPSTRTSSSSAPCTAS
jgi:hypothetical protein